MGKVNLPNLCQKKQHLYYRVRVRLKDGRRQDQYIPLGRIDDPQWKARYDKVAAPVAETEGAAAGSLEALIIDYRKALTNRRNRRGQPLSDVTLHNYRRYLDLLVKDYGRAPVRDMTTVDVIEMQDAFADRPGVANNLIARLRDVLEHGRRRGWIRENPATRIPALVLSEHQPWPAEVLHAAIQHASPMMRLAIITGLCTGWRDSDAIRIRHNWIEDGFCTVERQQKTGVTAIVPVHPLWAAEMAALPKRAVTLLYDRSGRPFKTTEPIQAAMRRLMAHEDVQAAIAEAAARGKCEPGDTFVFHGLRKNACCYLTELGLSDTRIGAALGMSPEMVRYYSKRRRILMLAKGSAEAIIGGNVVGLWKGPGGTPAKVGGNSQ